MKTESPQTLAARTLNDVRWSATLDRTAATAPARAAPIARVADEIDPHHELPPDERTRRATHAWYSELGRRSAAAQRTRKTAGGAA